MAERAQLPTSGALGLPEGTSRTPPSTAPSTQATTPQPTGESYRISVSKPVKKGWRSILKGAAMLLAAPFSIPVVVGYNVVRGAYNLYKKKWKGAAYRLAGGLLGGLAPLYYGLGLVGSGLYRIGRNRELPYDNQDYMLQLYGRQF